MTAGLTICQLLEIRRDFDFGSLERFLQVDSISILFWCDESDTSAFVTGSARSSSTMHVVLHMVRAIIVDDEFEKFDI